MNAICVNVLRLIQEMQFIFILRSIYSRRDRCVIACGGLIPFLLQCLFPPVHIIICSLGFTTL